MSDRESFKEWYDTIWLGDNEHGQFIPESNHVDYKEYLQGYTLAHGAWQARQAEITQLRQQLAEANKDAERMEWILDNYTSKGGGHGFTLSVFIPVDSECVRGAIDQAMQANKPNN